MDLSKKHIIYAVVAIIVILLIFILFQPISSIDADFKGEAQEFILEGNFHEIVSEAEVAKCNFDYTRIDGANSIILTYENGTHQTITEFDYINLYLNENVNPRINNVIINLYNFNESKIRFKNAEDVDLSISGNSDFWSNSIIVKPVNGISDVIFYNREVKSLLIDDTEITNFSAVIFNSKSNMVLKIGGRQTTVELLGVSDYEIKGDIASILLHRTEGLLRIGNRPYVVYAPDTFDVYFIPKASLILKNSDIEFEGVTYSSSLNNENLLTPEVIYWLNHKPENASVLLSFFLVAITYYYAVQTRKMVKHSQSSLEQTQYSIMQTEKRDLLKSLEKKLELFYCPLQNRLRKIKDDVESQKKNGKYSVPITDNFFSDLIPFQYMASDNLNKFLNEFGYNTKQTKDINSNNEVYLIKLLNQTEIDITEIKKQISSILYSSK
ncbi:hypothetical protein SAMN04488589_0053 [Methanolobus vulcani]|uniref:Uncharacterized protein n=1 Tax=Methanolobus vulcani TaxID=38026 RepID=A0A7Z7FBJ6_9EURY|nr:hypothetical protein [Methanolobus vulcani]SDF22961.1 hypothetical protein SAMN04488589_0053 [Methanolobus vulcani]